jgi:uncharacterized protein (UPF0335 family)
MGGLFIGANMDWTSILIAFVGGGTLIAVINGLFGRRHAQAETIELLLQTSRNQLEMMQEQMNAMQNRMDRLEKGKEADDMVIAQLKAQIKRLQEENDELKKQNVKLLSDNRSYGNQLKELREQLRLLKAGQDDNPC